MSRSVRVLSRALTAALLLALAAAAAANGPTGPGTGGWAGVSACRFAVPPDFPPTGLRWAGGCRDGLAEGRGVLRAYAGGRLVRAFYGRLEAGRLATGVVEVPDAGFIAGRFDPASGRPRDDGLEDDGARRNALIAAFDEASAAARELSQAFARTGNAASAQHYARKAEQLARQLD